jgi:hypothetical protein
MPRAARRRLIVAAAAAIVLLVAWLGYIGLFRNAVSDAYLIRLAAIDALKPIIDARKRHEVDDATFRAAMVRAKELQPQLDALEGLAKARQAHPLNIAAAYRYDRARGDALARLARLQNFTANLPATTRATP